MMQTTPNILKAVVKGRVQGVGFRAFVRDAAAKIGVTGWVRNREDGSVEVFAEGSEDDLTDLLTELHKGPPWAWVADIDVHWKSETAAHEDFRILR